MCLGWCLNSALGSICGQSRCRLNADKAAAIGAEMIAVHARGLFLTQFRQQKTAAQQYMLPSSISSETQSLWCVRRMKAMFFKDRAVKISGLSVDGVGICRGCKAPSGQNWQGNSSHGATMLTRRHESKWLREIGCRVWKALRFSVYCHDNCKSCDYMHIVSNHKLFTVFFSFRRCFFFPPQCFRLASFNWIHRQRCNLVSSSVSGVSDKPLNQQKTGFFVCLFNWVTL